MRETRDIDRAERLQFILQDLSEVREELLQHWLFYLETKLKKL